MGKIKGLLDDLEFQEYSEDILAQVIEEERELQFNRLYDDAFSDGMKYGLFVSIVVVSSVSVFTALAWGLLS